MKMTNKEYDSYVKKTMPKSPVGKNLLLAFGIGGVICCVGQAVSDMYSYFGLNTPDAAAATSVTMIFLGALTTGLGLYDDLAKYAGGGTLVPITGFSNSVVSPALEFKTEGMITGTAAKMFIVSGPVIVFGISASVVYGLVLLLFGLV